MRLLWLPERLRDFGLDVIETSGWTKRGSTAFDPAGVIVHHTASAAGRDAPSLKVCIDGRSDLPGPLCNILIGRDGTCYVIASGRANHAGQGSWHGHSGNQEFIGIEAENDGRGEPWTPKLLDAFHRATAACLVGINAGAQMCAGHKEYCLPKGRKTDPTLDMAEFRAAVGLDIQWWHNTQGDDDMPRYKEWPLEDKMLLANDVAEAVLARFTDSEDNDAGGRIKRATRASERLAKHFKVSLED